MKFFDSQSEAFIQWFLKLTFVTKLSTPCEMAWKTVPENGLFLCTILFEVTWAFCKMCPHMAILHTGRHSLHLQATSFWPLQFQSESWKFFCSILLCVLHWKTSYFYNFLKSNPSLNHYRPIKSEKNQIPLTNFFGPENGVFKFTLVNEHKLLIYVIDWIVIIMSEYLRLSNWSVL